MLKQKRLQLLSYTLIFLASAFGFFILSFVILNFSDFSGDQINDAYRVMGIWEGNWPTLGPGPTAWSGIAGGEFYLPPLYYFLVFPFTIFTPNLSAQAIANAIFTFLSIPLIIFTVYFLLENIANKKRLFLSSLAGFWYICLFQNIVMSTGNSLAGNPVSITFFLLCFVLLYYYQSQKKLPPVLEILSWLAYGFVLAILTNLHFAPFFIMPIVFAISIIFYISKKIQDKKRWMLSGISILASVLAMTPYWIGEINRNWTNTKVISSLLLRSSTEKEHGTSLLARLKSILDGYFGLGQEVYFIGQS